MVKAEPFESLVSADARLQELGLQAGDRTASARTIEEVGKAKPELLPLLLKPLQPLVGDESPTVVKRAMQTLTSLYRPALALIAEQPSPVPPELLEMWERLGELKAQALSALETSASDAVRTNAVKFAASLVLAFCSPEGGSAGCAYDFSWSVAWRSLSRWSVAQLVAGHPLLEAAALREEGDALLQQLLLMLTQPLSSTLLMVLMNVLCDLGKQRPPLLPLLVPGLCELQRRVSAGAVEGLQRAQLGNAQTSLKSALLALFKEPAVGAPSLAAVEASLLVSLHALGAASQAELHLRHRRELLSSGRAESERAMAWRSEAADDHSRVLARCFAGADHGAGAAAFTAQEEDEIWQAASSWKGYCERLAIRAAYLGHEGCLRVLHELGGEAAASLAAPDDRRDVAASLAAAAKDGWTPAHSAARHGHEGCLRVLHELGGEAAASLAAANANGATPAHSAAENGHEGCLRVLHELGGEAASSLAAEDLLRRTPAHLAARKHAGCLRVLHELGGEAAASLAAADDRGNTPAHWAATNGHDGCLRVLHEAAASLAAVTADGWTPAHLAAGMGHEGCLRVLHELGGEAAASLFDHVDLANSQRSPAARAAKRGHANCFRFLAEIGGAAAFLEHLRGRESLIDSKYPCLLTDPALLDLGTKRAWLNAQLSRKVQAAGSDAVIELIVHRDDMLHGLCDALGVHEVTGQVNAQARSVSVTFHGEAAVGDGLRREWFGQTTKEMIDPNRGLFRSLDGGRTLQPNPESGDHAADHLAHFALLGRIAGMALHHREPLDVSWSAAFLKAVLGYSISVDDVALVDTEICENMLKLRGYTAEVLQATGFTFDVDSEVGQQDFVVEASKRRRVSIELKQNGLNINVTPENLEEYLQLKAEHHVIGSIREQVNAMRQGLSVFLDDALMAKLRAFCTVAEFQLMLCGAPEIDVDDWQASTEYRGGYSAGSDQVKWFWAEVRGMTPEERGQLLFFCTGSTRAPATGFANLMGYNGKEQQRFSIERDDRGTERPPTAATCINSLMLPPYASAETLARKLRLIFWAEGFHEGAVAT